MIDTSFLDRNKNMAVVIRHSERNPIPDGVHDIVTPINKRGEAIATELGAQFSLFDTLEMISSPVERCLQTGRAILVGFQKQATVRTSNLLGEPGPFVFDCEVAKDHFINMTCKTVVESQIAGQELAGIRPIAEGSKMLKDFIVSELQKNKIGNLLVFITHDAILAPFIFQYTGEKFNHEHWIDYIDGIAFIAEKKEIQIIRNGRKYAIH
jgi:broad specificity phosphatase PhoE